MNSISQIKENKENTKRYLPHEIKTKENAVKTYLNNGDIEYIHAENIIYQDIHYGDG